MSRLNRPLKLTELQTEFDRLASNDNRKLVLSKAYSILALSEIYQYNELRSISTNFLFRKFKSNNWQDLFIAGEYLDKLKNEVEGEVISSAKEHFPKEYLGVLLPVKLASKSYETVKDKRVFKELEPFISEHKIVDRVGQRTGQQRRRIKAARDKAQAVSHEQVVQRRRADQAYAREMARLEQQLRKQ
ncbi:hypothetical protein NEHOM01_2356 [Nematocida homosporus]|uniref:uncharacterized protein n=1 Tax=Nematocida homosporus TaxID=1912981 RepID=UPI002220092E|nr:uncharacterized protein NEHOM01_2356 [Nematocida homosporus]KAI5187769.1 hypothetical protein NEHOM01_2356 [Nematocida homosporus]